MKVIKFFTAICIVAFLFCICGDSVKNDAKFFKLLWKLDSVAKYKREKAYVLLEKLLISDLDIRYVEIMKRRLRRVNLEQKLILQNLIDKFEKVAKQREILFKNKLLKKCPNLLPSAVDFLSGTTGYYKNYGKKKSIEAAKRLDDIFFYAGIFKNKQIIPLAPALENSLKKWTIDRLLEVGDFKNINKLVVDDSYDRYISYKDFFNIFLYVHNRKLLRRIGNKMLQFVCIKNFNELTYPYHYKYKNKSSLGFDQSMQSGVICENFLKLFGSYISNIAIYKLMNRYRDIVYKIKSGSKGNSLYYLLTLDMHLSSILKFKLSKQVYVYKRIVRERVIKKLNQMNRSCKRLKGIVRIEEGFTNNLIEYLKEIPDYFSVIKDTSSVCLFLQTYNISSTDYAYYLEIKSRKKVQIMNPVARSVVNKSVYICDNDTLNSLICYNSLYAIKILSKCKNKRIKKVFLSKLGNFNRYIKLCDIYDSNKLDNWYFNNMIQSYIQVLKILGLLHDNMSAILKYTIRNGYFTYYTATAIDMLTDILDTIKDEGKKNTIMKNVFTQMLLYVDYLSNSYRRYYNDNLNLRRYIYVSKNNQIDYDDILSKFRTLNNALNVNNKNEMFIELLSSNKIRKILLRMVNQKILKNTPLYFKNLFKKHISKFSGYDVYRVLELFEIISRYIPVSTHFSDNYLPNDLTIPFSFFEKGWLYRQPDYDKNAYDVAYKIAQKKSSIFTLIFLIKNEKLKQKIVDNMQKLLERESIKLKDKKILKDDKRYSPLDEYNELKEEIITGIMKNTLWFKNIYNYEVRFQNAAENEFFIREQMKFINKILKNICSMPAVMNYPLDIIYYFRSMFNTYRSRNSDIQIKNSIYKILYLFPTLLYDIRMSIPIGENLYYSTIDGFAKDKDFHNTFCKGSNCLNEFKIEFLNGTDDKIKEIYKKIIGVEGKFLKYLDPYMPIIVNSRTRKIIASDYVIMHRLLLKIFKNSIKKHH